MMDVIEKLKSKGWLINNINEHGFVTHDLKEFNISRYSFQKTYIDGIDVMISIHEINSLYSVIYTSESRGSGPSEMIIAENCNLEIALEYAEKECLECDKDFS